MNKDIKTKIVSARLDQKLFNKLYKLAIKHNWPISKTIEVILEGYLNSDK
jgi:hypothetical protein